MIIRSILAFGIGLALLTGAQHLWVAGIQNQIAAVQQMPPPFVGQPVGPFDMDKMARAINPPITIDTHAAQRAAAESMIRQIDQQNRNALSHVPVAPYIPGMHH
jgi:hypothetical protein